MIDYGHVYASKSFFDGKKNMRIIWSGVNELDSEADDVKKGWSGIQVSVFYEICSALFIINFNENCKVQYVILFASHSQGLSGWIWMESN